MLELIGAYQVKVSDEEFRFIAEQVTGSVELAQEEQRFGVVGD